MSETVNETGTRDTTGATGDDAAPESNTADTASNRDTTGVVGDAGTQYDPQPRPANQPDTSGAQGGEAGHHDEEGQFLTGTLETTQAGGPQQHADPVYRTPAGDVAANVRDTTLTDLRLSDGSEPDESRKWMTETFDTQNPKVPLQTTTENLPGAPGAAPAVAGVARGVEVTLTPVSDPAGAPVRGYRVEGTTGGLDFAARNQTEIVVGNLVPSQAYKFRYAAVNDNGVGPFSAWSVAVTPLNPDEPGPGQATTITAENRVNPIYGPDGSIKPGTGGTTGPVGSVTAAATANPGELDVDWTAPAWGDADGFVVRASSGEEVTVGDVLTATLTGLESGTPVTVTVTPTNERGEGLPKTSTAATPA